METQGPDPAMGSADADTYSPTYTYPQPYVQRGVYTNLSPVKLSTFPTIAASPFVLAIVGVLV